MRPWTGLWTELAGESPLPDALTDCAFGFLHAQNSQTVFSVIRRKSGTVVLGAEGTRYPEHFESFMKMPKAAAIILAGLVGLACSNHSGPGDAGAASGGQAGSTIISGTTGGTGGAIGSGGAGGASMGGTGSSGGAGGTMGPGAGGSVTGGTSDQGGQCASYRCATQATRR